ncbi:DUF885 domain-containing protein [Corynebacterium caspium]|uniref:DUF885 domain-containing protein n=1 Tax=Corynebacterium caspium TaxID=234828 RepID=UPI00037A3D7B|nr:DUF885 domain-containing protein [Corynebacterium caspium]WKD58499.1 hypothetical protein CCASP_00315 [Corynebacterium caspium DSM 44850]
MNSETTPRPGAERQPSILDAACDAFVMDLAELTPTDATAWGVADESLNSELQDFSPEYWERRAQLMRNMLMDVDALDESTDDSDDDDDFDDVDHLTAAVLRDRLTLELDKHHAGEDLRLLNNIESPVQIIRDTFLMMDTSTAAGRDAIRGRMAKIPQALRGYQESLSAAAGQGHVAAIRQIDKVISQCEALADTDSMLNNLGVEAHSAEVQNAKRAFGELSAWLGDNLVSMAPARDAVGRDRYELFAHEFIGDEIDLDEAYKWSLERLHEVREEQNALVRELYGPDISIRQAFHNLNHDERYTIHGSDNLQKWMQNTSDAAVAALDGKYFDIPAEIRTLECRIDPAGTGAIYYTPPTDDLQRPGRMWWSVPESQNTFHTWQELTTVYHEGVPGHHLQCGTTVSSDVLNMWRRTACWISGHGEGWALYAEQLMADLGFHEDLGTRLGLLDSQRLRLARVALDIGVHLRKQVPTNTGVWDASYAKWFLRENTAMDEAVMSFELNRYLGWPGQAPSYALGQRLWEETRDAALAEGQTLREFHANALALGSIPMSILAKEVLNN